MRQELLKFYRTNRLLNRVVVIAIIFVIIFNIPSFKLEIPFSGFWYSLALAITSSFVFYIIITYAPENTKKKHLSPLINKHLKFLLAKAAVPFEIFGNNCWWEELTLDEIQNKLENLTDKDEVTHVNFVSDWGFRHPNRGEYLITQHEQMKEEAKIIFNFSPYLDDTLYLLVSDITLSWYNDRIGILKLVSKLPNKYSLKFLAAEIYDYKNILIQLKEYLEKIN